MTDFRTIWRQLAVTIGTLEHVGFKASEARARVDAVIRAGAPADLESFVRAALA